MFFQNGKGRKRFMFKRKYMFKREHKHTRTSQKSNQIDIVTYSEENTSLKEQARM